MSNKIPAARVEPGDTILVSELGGDVHLRVHIVQRCAVGRDYQYQYTGHVTGPGDQHRFETTWMKPGHMIDVITFRGE